MSSRWNGGSATLPASLQAAIASKVVPTQPGSGGDQGAHRVGATSGRDAAAAVRGPGTSTFRIEGRRLHTPHREPKNGQSVAATSAIISGVVSAASAVDMSRLLATGPCITWNWRDIR